MKKNWICVGSILAVFIVTIVLYCNSLSRLTYLEYTVKNGEYDSTVELTANGDSLTQDFRSDYNILHGFKIRIDTFGRDNNSFWNIALTDPKNGQVLYEEKRNAGHFPDKKDCLIEFKKNIRVEKEHIYQIRITADHVDKANSIAFCKQTGASDGTMIMAINGQNTGDKLYLSIYGGNRDRWWSFYVVLLGLIVSLIIIRFCFISRKDVRWYDDKLLAALLLGAAIFVLLKTFAVCDGFTDEYDNMLGGMVIAQGKVLYRDYVTQHMPLGYYLCAAFAFLGAKSVEQFRLMYYLTVSLIWGAVYYRYGGRIGRRRIAALAVAETVLVSALYAPNATMILADNIHGLLLVVLLLEFMLYYSDRDLGWSRSAVVSLCIWGCIGSAFISVYSIVWVALAVGFIELREGFKTKRTIGEAFKRYYRFVIAILVPPMIGVLYFSLNRVLEEAYKQAYLFNRELFPDYLGSMGGSLWEPVAQMFQNLFGFIDDSVQHIITQQAAREILPQLIVLLAAMAVLAISLYNRRYIESALLFLVLCSTATRGMYTIHCMPVWYIAVMITVVLSGTKQAREHSDELCKEERRGKELRLAAAAVTLVYLCSFYIALVGENLQTKQQSISEQQRVVIAETEYGDPVMIDAYRQKPLYYLYRGRVLANKTAYMLPWYMDWFEPDTIRELNEKKPRAVIFKENMEVWGYKNYARGLVEELRKNYHRISDNPDDGWMYTVWLPNDKK